MKKSYITPNALVVVLDLQDIVAMSNEGQYTGSDNLSGADGSDDSDFKGARRGSDWENYNGY